MHKLNEKNSKILKLYRNLSNRKIAKYSNSMKTYRNKQIKKCKNVHKKDKETDYQPNMETHRTEK